MILEIATDKVDTEIQAPADGVLLKINYRNGEIAPVNAVMGYIGAPGETVDEGGAAEAAPAKVPEAAPRPARTGAADRGCRGRRARHARRQTGGG
ncbi:MAG: hypothetical protein KatS3mg048_2091 [Caldilinea sp.]|nr:MAG: hypothetical protein KatS3mg048_2091 [Caldilinea sp.]